MDLNQIQSLIKFVSKSGVNEVELETKDFKINIKTKSSESTGAVTTMQMPGYPMMQPMAPQQMAAAPAPAATAPAAASAPAAEEPKAEDSKHITFKSPMIGTFYRSSTPDKPPFVNVGDRIEQGNPICIIEAMKLFNEIEAEFSGTIVKVLVDDATPVEYDTPLFLIDPS